MLSSSGIRLYPESLEAKDAFEWCKRQVQLLESHILAHPDYLKNGGKYQLNIGAIPHCVMPISTLKLENTIKSLADWVEEIEVKEFEQGFGYMGLVIKVEVDIFKLPFTNIKPIIEYINYVNGSEYADVNEYIYSLQKENFDPEYRFFVLTETLRMAEKRQLKGVG